MDGATINLYRGAMGLTVTDLADRLGVDRRTIQRWENNSWPIPPDSQALIEDMWQNWLDRIDSLLERAESFPEGAQADLAHYRDGVLAAQNQALAVLLGLADRDVSAHWVPVEE